VLEKFRGRGVATRLTELALDRQRQLGMSKCHLMIFNNNADGKEFWEKQGFRIRNDIGIMSREI
jgi:ribosomal protein S18 acetylase RimI-like enzyme